MSPFKFLSLTFGLYMSLVIVFGGGHKPSTESIPTVTHPWVTVQILSPEQQIDRIAELTTTTTTLAPVVIVDVSDDTKCQQWLQTAIKAGWPNERKIMDRLGFIMWRESRCLPTADSGPDHGLTQINKVHTHWINELGWTFEQMKDPAKNLRFAWLLYSGREANGQCGWQPWSMSC